MTANARRALRAVLALMILGVVGIQFVRPERSNPAIDPARTLPARLDVPPDVLGMLERSCSDCHSHQTRWPWYSQVAPVSWMLAEHVREGRSELNLSDWAQYNELRAGKKLEEMRDELRKGGMPLGGYLRLHRDARLTPAQVDRICAWIADELARRGYTPSSADGDAASAGAGASPGEDRDDHGR